MSDPLLSVTVNNYNYGRYLEQTIGSILAQSFTDFELILIDNASSDESVDVMRKFEAIDPRVRVVVHPENLGMFASLQESCELSRGKYRLPVEADDWVLATDAFQVQVDLLEANPSMAFVYSAMTMMGGDDDVFFVSRPYPGDCVLPGAQAVEAILSFALTHTGMMMRTDALRQTNGYRDKYRHIADMALAVDLCNLGDVGYLDRSLYGFRQHDSNLHNEPLLDLVSAQLLPLIDETFAGPLGKKIPDTDAVHKRVLRRGLTHIPTQYIFSGYLRHGWRVYWENVKLQPVLTIVQPRSLSLLARTLLGNRGYQWLTTKVRGH